MKSCSIDGCNSEVVARTFCVKHYNRFKRNGDPLKTTRVRNMFSLTDFVKNTPDILDYVFTKHSQWTLACKLHYGDKCSKCGWNERTCDTNHIVPKSKGGLNTIRNGIVLCPNCHALEHRHLPLEQRQYITRN